MTMAAVTLNARCMGRVMAGHPWIYEGDVQSMASTPADGGEIEVRGPGGKVVGTGLYNSRSRIPIRIYSRRAGAAIDEAFLRARIEASWALRRAEGIGEVCRVVWSEADFLPGVVIDRYGDAWVLQTLTAPMDQRKALLAGILEERFGAQVVVERNDVPSRRHEGLESVKGVLRGEGATRRPVGIGRAQFEVDLLEGQKTGAYLDQAANQVAVGAIAGGKRVLDCFTYHGGFALHAALGGAAEVTAIDLSEPAIETARRNAGLNRVISVQWRAANVFDELGERSRAGETYDLVILDPPSFTRSRAKVGDALRGYKEIHVRALSMLRAGGQLATFCCSHHVSADTFRAVALDAAFDVGRILRLRRTFTQGPDHPIVPAVPETEYLKGFLFDVVDAG